YKVLIAGYPLMIVDNGAGHPKRMGTLSVRDGRFEFDTDKGVKPTPDQSAAFQKRLDAFQKIQHGDK
ncbi:MAG TPA: hypothetical protein VMF58_09030, partial [Rhizomicrobium sp.]|nr:hypothetical protein [Rhizomicrobium sp.]